MTVKDVQEACLLYCRSSELLLGYQDALILRWSFQVWCTAAVRFNRRQDDVRHEAIMDSNSSSI